MKVEEVKSVDELTDEDFTAPTRNVQLPALSQKVSDAIGADGKPVVIKKNIFARNSQSHSEVTPQQAREILSSALYRPDLYGQNQKASRPYNWIVINTKDADGQNRLVVLEVNDNKDNIEIVHWYSVRDNSLRQIERQAREEGGHILTLPSETEEAGALSGRQSGLSSAGKVTESSGNSNTSEEKTEENAAPKNEGQFGLVSDARMEELKKRLKAKLTGQLNSGFDPEVLAIGMEMAAGYIDRGVKAFVDFSQKMIEEFGDIIRPYLKAFYNGAREMPGMEDLAKEMDSHDAVSAFDVNNFDRQTEEKEEASAESQTARTETAPKNSSESQTEQTDKRGNNQSSEKQTNTASEKIDDVGEKIAGARKDMLRDMAKSMKDVTEESLIALPFAKAFKRPDLNKAVAEGALRPKDARFAEAVMTALLSTSKPRLSKSRSSYERQKSEIKIKNWAKNARIGVTMLEQLFSMDESQRDAFIEKAMNLTPYDEAAVDARIAQLKEWNGHNKNVESFGRCKPLNLIAVYHKAYEQLGYDTYGDVKCPVATVRPSSVYDCYVLVDANGNRMSMRHPLEDEQAVVDEIVYATKVANGDMDTDHPNSSFSVIGTEPKYEVDGYNFFYQKGLNGSVQISAKFKTAEEAEAARQKMSERGYSVGSVGEAKTQNGYKKYVLAFNTPYAEPFELPEYSAGSKGELLSMLDAQHDEINDAVNSKLAEGKQKTRQTKDKAQVLGHWDTERKGMVYSVCLSDKYTPKDIFSNMPYTIKDGFATKKEAEAYLEEHRTEIEKLADDIDRTRREFVYFDGTNESRVGEDYRKGKDVSAEEFISAFGFRGVQFGNWTNQKDRQAAINNAYDSFMDLAKLLGISPKALSLNGELGIAFGARGSGSAAAHYEPAEVVINLTKTQGAGSLAHEWWHALDNYFGRQGNVKLGFVTDNRGIRMRDEMRQAFNRLLDRLEKSDYDSRSRQRGKSYWGSKVEETARMFEMWVSSEMAKRGESNNFLVGNGKGMEERFAEKNYANYMTAFFLGHKTDGKPMTFGEFCKTPYALAGFVYPTRAELETFGSDLRNIFDTVQERVDEETGNVALFQMDGSERDNTSPESQLAFDTVTELLDRAGVETELMSNEEMEQLAEGATEDASLSRSKSPRTKWLDAYVYVVSRFLGKSRSEARAEMLQKIAQAKKEAKELYERVLSGNFDGLTLRKINEYIDNATNRNRFFRPLSQRLPERALLSLSKDDRTAAVDALFSRICESTVPANGRTRAEGRRKIEARKEELLEAWAKATGNWHESIADFTSRTDAIRSGTDSDVYLSDDGTKVIKASKGKFDNRKFPTDIDQVPLFNSVFPGSAYRIVGYGRLDGKFVRFLEQPFVDFSTATPLSTEERVAYMKELGFEAKNEDKTLFSNGEIAVSDLQKSNIVRGTDGNVWVIDADVKIHTKDMGGNYTYPPVETDTDTAELMTDRNGSEESGSEAQGGGVEFLKNGSTVYGAAVGGKILLNAERLNPNTPVHEYTHLWDKAVQQKNPELWKRGVELMKQTSLWQEVANDPNYAGLDENGIASEVHSRLAGDKGESELERMSREVLDSNGGILDKAAKMSVIQKLRKWMSDFWYWVKNTLTPWSAEEAERVTLEDFVNMPLADLAKGTRLNETQLNAEERGIVEKAKADGTYMKAPNGKPSNLNERQWAQVHTKAFKDWFGDWELGAKAVNIVRAVKQHGFRNFGEAKTWAKENIVRTLSNEETGGKGEIRISGTSIEKFLSESSMSKSDSKDVHLSVLKVLPDVIKESVDAEQHPDYKKGADGKRNAENSVNENVTIHRLYGAVTIDGKVYRVKVTVKEDRTNAESKKAYNYEATKIELLAGQNEEAVTSSRYSNNSISAANLLKGVEKSYNKGQKLLDFSQVVDENGEPKVVYHGTNDEFTVFDPEKGDYVPYGDRVSRITDKHRCFYFADLQIMAGSYGTSQMKPVFLNIRDAYNIDAKGRNWNNLRLWESEPYEGEDIIKLAEATYNKLRGRADVADLTHKFFPDDHSETEERTYLKNNSLVQMYEEYREIENSRPKNLLEKVVRSLRLAIAVRNMEKRRDAYREWAKTEDVPYRESAFTLRTRDLDVLLNDRDGIILRSIMDYGSLDNVENPEPGNVFVVYNPNNIKSATDNTGEFSTEDNDIRFQIETDNTGKPVRNISNDIASMETPIHESKGTFKNLAEAEDWAKKNLQGKSYTNQFTGDEVRISGKSISEMLNPKSSKKISEQVHLAALQSVPDFIKTGIPAEIHKDTHGRGYDVMRLYNAIKINGETYRVKSTIKRLNIGDNYYTYEIQEMEIIGGTQSPAVGLDGTDNSRPQTYNSISGANLLKGVKKTNSDELILPERTDAQSQVGTDSEQSEPVRFRENASADNVDAAYNEAVEKGNKKEAQRLVDEQAEKMMPDSKVRGKKGKLMKVYHGSGSYDHFDIFSREESYAGFFFTDKKPIAQSYIKYDKQDTGAKPLYSAYLNMENPFVLDCGGSGWQDLKIKAELRLEGTDNPIFHEMCKRLNSHGLTLPYGEYRGNVREFGDDNDRHSMLQRLFSSDELKEIEKEVNPMDIWNYLVPEFDADGGVTLTVNTNTAGFIAERCGYDGVIFNNIRDHAKGAYSHDEDDISNVYVVFQPNQIKSADAVTRDDEGKVIPLSERFNEGSEDIRFRDNGISAVNSRFNEELEKQANGELEKGHIYQLGKPSAILRSTGVPNLPIELTSQKLAEKSEQRNHTFDILDVVGLPAALQSPMAVFSYGDKGKAQNIIVSLQRDGKQFVVGLHFNQEKRGLLVNDIRGLFNKNNAEWLNWISQGKALYINKGEIQALIDQQRTNLAEVEYLDLDSIAKVVNEFENPKLDEETATQNDAGAEELAASSAKDRRQQSDSPVANHSMSLDGMRDAGQQMSESLGVEVVFIKDSELPEGHRGAMGMWKGGKVYVCLENHTSADEVKKTILHEVVGHKGLRNLVGNRAMDSFLTNSYRNDCVQEMILRLNKGEIQALIDQQRTNLADVEYLDLDSIAKVVNGFENPKRVAPSVVCCLPQGIILSRNGTL